MYWVERLDRAAQVVQVEHQAVQVQVVPAEVVEHQDQVVPADLVVQVAQVDLVVQVVQVVQVDLVGRVYLYREQQIDWLNLLVLLRLVIHQLYTKVDLHFWVWVYHLV